jgi:HTH-type transcriptional regulator/antitoxin HigA
VERYEQEHYSIPAADPASVVRFLIEQQNLTQRDLIPQFGSVFIPKGDAGARA